MTAPWQAHFLRQAEACDGLGSPFTAALLRTLAHDMPPGAVAARIAAWPVETLSPDALALRLAGGLHALVLQGRDAALAACYPPHQGALSEVLPGTLATHEAHLLHWLDSAPQTNEIRRSAALILAAGLLAERFPDQPLQLSELGASAGLNLQFDRYGMEVAGQRFGAAAPLLTLTPDWQGELPPRAAYRVAEARGVDLNPLDPGSPADMLRLRSYTWADQPDRMARLDAALAGEIPAVDRGDAAAWLEDRLAAPARGRVHLVYHTIAWQYFPAETKARCEAALARAGALATPEAPLARLSFEADASERPGAALRLTTWPGGETQELGRVDFHGRWLHRA
ncbi:hypothetical protein SAMN06297129_0959 [Pseudooceanicola antarcticus]|uniref:DUF2332 domain-containing protein n=1 Tax=Pseudooceanicola antarcticus TaxID=1247613 RepID=A0A285IHL0_9RHOB|nr:DUF2332 family protein [Pseudooceanicola antarcticus]PJE29156.1 DUF2332 domain-containing protein [Pseudooceanicola antarcticus]SNY46431.1 hypothetical protein SAMN06297129_0959 [Pseudooceanicola antarcticus]